MVTDVIPANIQKQEETKNDVKHSTVVEGYDKNDWDYEDTSDGADEFCE